MSLANDVPKSGAQDNFLDADGLSALSSRALSGDGAAASKIVAYYLTSRYDIKEAKYWALIAAENDDPIGQYNAGFLLKDDADPRNRARAKFWLQKCIERGDANARALLLELH